MKWREHTPIALGFALGAIFCFVLLVPILWQGEHNDWINIIANAAAALVGGAVAVCGSLLAVQRQIAHTELNRRLDELKARQAALAPITRYLFDIAIFIDQFRRLGEANYEAKDLFDFVHERLQNFIQALEAAREVSLSNTADWETQNRWHNCASAINAALADLPKLGDDWSTNSCLRRYYALAPHRDGILDQFDSLRNYAQSILNGP